MPNLGQSRTPRSQRILLKTAVMEPTQVVRKRTSRPPTLADLPMDRPRAKLSLKETKVMVQPSPLTKLITSSLKRTNSPICWAFLRFL